MFGLLEKLWTLKVVAYLSSGNFWFVVLTQEKKNEPRKVFFYFYFLFYMFMVYLGS